MGAGNFANAIRLKRRSALRANHLDARRDRAHRMRSLPTRRAAKFGGHGGGSVINLGGAQQYWLADRSTVCECVEGNSLTTPGVRKLFPPKTTGPDLIRARSMPCQLQQRPSGDFLDAE
jgi:hypothetical protein